MNAPAIWILFPGICAAALYFLRRWTRLTNLAGISIALLLAILALAVPIGETFSLAPIPALSALQIGDTWVFQGRRFILEDSSRPALAFVFLSLAFWFGGASAASTNRLFVPVGLGIVTLLNASVAVEPFLYAALLIEMAALVSIPMLSPPGKPAGRGILRFLTFQTLGLPFILLAGWLLSGTEINPADPEIVLRAAVMMILGFSFQMAVFPFHTWIPMLAEEVHPYSAAFVLFVIPSAISLLALEFLNRYAWLGTEAGGYLVLQFLGALMVLAGGIWAAFQRNLKRMLGYAAITETGQALLALSLGFSGVIPADPAGSVPLVGLYFAQFLPRMLGLTLWALGLSTLQTAAPGLDFEHVRGIARKMPAASAAVALAHISLAGFPLLASFPTHLALWSALSVQSLPATLLSLIGSAGLLMGALRTLAVLLTGSGSEEWQVLENRRQLGLLAAGGILLFLLGIFPQWFLPSLVALAGG